MGLDVRLSSRKAIICPHCGKVVDYKFLDTVYSGGSVWYGFLKDIGYYVPNGELEEKNDWYGKDMVLTKEQAKNLVKYIKDNGSFDYGEIKALAIKNDSQDKMVFSYDVRSADEKGKK